MELLTVAGEPSYRLESDKVTLCVSRTGGQVGPVLFNMASGIFSPFSVAPWAGTPESKSLLPVLRVLRGDFFCMPFGANAAPFEGENHPLHGETANGEWQVQTHTAGELELALAGDTRPYKISKRLLLREGHAAVYQVHSITGLRGPMCYGHHAMLHFPPDSPAGHVSVSPFVHGQVFPGEFESPAAGGYSSLRPGARFESLRAVPAKDGSEADLSGYPAREGFEDLAMVSADPSLDLAWSACTFPGQGAFWLSLKNRRDFPSTILWHSNGGRHYPPWSGRHRGVLGIEEVCAYFHYGLAESVAPNPISALGIPTFRTFRPDKSVELPTIMAAGELPPKAGEVRVVRPSANGAEVTFASGESVRLSLDLSFLRL